MTDKNLILFEGPKGALPLQADDIVAVRLAMLYEGKCTKLGPEKAAKKYGYTRQRYYQLLHIFLQEGSHALRPKSSGPKKNHVRSETVINQIIRHRFLDPDANADVIAQKLRQQGIKISKRSVELTITEQGLQKKEFISSVPKERNKESRRTLRRHSSKR